LDSVINMKFEIEENGKLEEDIDPVIAGMADLLKCDNKRVGACIKTIRKKCRGRDLNPRTPSRQDVSSNPYFIKS